MSKNHKREDSYRTEVVTFIAITSTNTKSNSLKSRNFELDDYEFGKLKTKNLVVKPFKKVVTFQPKSILKTINKPSTEKIVIFAEEIVAEVRQVESYKEYNTSYKADRGNEEEEVSYKCKCVVF